MPELTPEEVVRVISHLNAATDVGNAREHAVKKHGDDAADKLDFMLNDWSLVYTSLLIDRGNMARAMMDAGVAPVDFVMVLAEELAEAFTAMREGDFEAAYHEFAQVAAVVQLGMAGIASRR